MSVNEKTSGKGTRIPPKFITQYNAPLGPFIEVNDGPSMTVPEQGLTIQEILARYVRTGVMPVAVHDDNGGNQAFEPDFDPLDASPEQVRTMLAKAKEKAKKDKAEEADPEPPNEENEEA